MTGQRSEVARASGPVTGGKGWPFGSPLNVEQYGCVLEEFLIEGVAQSYEPTPGSTIGLDGKWSVQPAGTAEYRTRMYVVRPTDPARFNGVVVVNWQNVTSGVDLGAPSPREMRNGYAWAGVTTQRVAIGPVGGCHRSAPGAGGVVPCR
jgi:Alpha/beta hydrolase domain